MAWMRTALAAAVAVGIALTPAGAAGAADRPWMDRTLPPDQRARLIVAAMTLDEKVQQIHMVDQPTRPREVAGIPRLGLATFKITNGPSGAGPGDAQGAQPATALPSALALSASWDTGLANAFGSVAGQEVASRPEHLLEAPGVNITRVPRNGRNFEYFGEDPYLSGQIAVSEVRGVQAQGILVGDSSRNLPLGSGEVR
jgi:beta-glucosidase